MFKNRIKAALLGVCILTAAFAQSAIADPAGFILHNTTGVEIHAVYIGSSDDEEWGDNLLDEDEMVEDGGDVSIEFAPEEDRESWDIRVEDSEGNSLNFMEVELLPATTVILKDDNTAVIK